MEPSTKQIEYIIKYMSEEILKILKINLQTDSFDLIKADEEELKEERGYSPQISEWIANTLENEQIHPDDVKRFKKTVNLDNLIDFFLAGNKKLAISYRKRIGLHYQWVAMRIIPAMDYSADNQVVIMFVQVDDSAEALEMIQTARQQYAVMKCLAGIYVTMHVINLETDVFFNVEEEGGNGVTFRRVDHAQDFIIKTMKERISKESIDLALEFTDLNTLPERMKGKKYLSEDIKGTTLGWVRGTFVTINTDDEGRPVSVLFVTSAINEEKERQEKLLQMSTEMNLATAIQTNTIPHVFPPFPDIPEVDLYASMDPAKEVGGDFYDFYMIDEHHMGLTIADVSGKGVPAALYMMVSKVLLKNAALMKYSPAKILEIVNNQLCDGNYVEMFVTVWLGILDIRTGKMTCANAGHEYPILKRKNSPFELFRDKHGFVLGGMEGVRYREYEIQLEKGDTFFIYTDGVPEATNADQVMFGFDRTVSVLNQNPDVDCKTMISAVRKSIDEFVMDAPQFDDITMLAITYNG